MKHSMTRIWIHAFFGTRDFLPLITDELKPKLYSHIFRKMNEDLKCKVRIIGGLSDHLHILFQLNPNFPLKDVLKMIKGESSNWINQENLIDAKFSWQMAYGAHSVSHSKVSNVEAFIKNQAEYHKKISVTDEFKKLFEKHDLVQDR